MIERDTNKEIKVGIREDCKKYNVFKVLDKVPYYDLVSDLAFIIYNVDKNYVPQRFVLEPSYFNYRLIKTHKNYEKEIAGQKVKYIEPFLLPQDVVTSESLEVNSKYFNGRQYPILTPNGVINEVSADVENVDYIRYCNPNIVQNRSNDYKRFAVHKSFDDNKRCYKYVYAKVSPVSMIIDEDTNALISEKFVLNSQVALEVSSYVKEYLINNCLASSSLPAIKGSHYKEGLQEYSIIIKKLKEIAKLEKEKAAFEYKMKTSINKNTINSATIGVDNRTKMIAFYKEEIQDQLREVNRISSDDLVLKLK